MRTFIYPSTNTIFLPTNQVDKDDLPLWQQMQNGVLVGNYYNKYEIYGFGDSEDLETISDINKVLAP